MDQAKLKLAAVDREAPKDLGITSDNTLYSKSSSHCTLVSKSRLVPFTRLAKNVTQLAPYDTAAVFDYDIL